MWKEKEAILNLLITQISHCREGLAVSILSGWVVAQTRACSTYSQQCAGSIPSTSVKFPELTQER